MRAPTLTLASLALLALFACSSSSSQSGPAPLDSVPPRADGGDVDGAVPPDVDGGSDANDPDGGIDPGPPAVQYIGRFDLTDPNAPLAAWPGVRAVARFDGPQVSVRLGQTDGFSGGPSWFDLTIDGVAQAPFSVATADETHELASGLAAGVHTVEIAKRTEPKLGAVLFGGFTFAGGTLLAPPARAKHKVEFLSDSTIDGFGVEGDRTTTCLPAGDYPQLDNAEKSMAYFATKGLAAEQFLLGYSGKGLTRNEDPSDTDTYDKLYAKIVPDDPTSMWAFAAWTPDVVVISLGGEDYNGGDTTPAGFDTAYGALVDTIRSHYANAHLYLTIWSQIKDATRTAMKSALDGIVAARAGDTKLHVFQFTQADPSVETACYYHANAAHHQAAAAELVTQVKADLGW